MAPRYAKINNWFDASVYTAARAFTAADWYLSLVFRRQAEKQLESDCPVDIDRYWEDYIAFANPQNIGGLYNKPELLATLDPVQAVEEISGGPWQNRPQAKLVDGKLEIPVREDIAQQANDIVVWSFKRILLVDLGATDETVRDSFEEWLKASRNISDLEIKNRGPGGTSTRVADEHFRSWRDHHILARLDLIHWANVFGVKKITDEAFGELVRGEASNINPKPWGTRCRRKISEAYGLIIQLQLQAKQDERVRRMISNTEIGV